MNAREVAEGNIHEASRSTCEDFKRTARSHDEGIASFDEDFRRLGVEWREPG